MTARIAPSLTASMTPVGTLARIRWYSGTFKETSTGLFKAVYRGFRNIITQNRNLI